jgi:predicted Zn-dependent peptidase
MVSTASTGAGVKENIAKGETKPPGPADPLAKPALGPPKSFTPAAPEVLKAAGGMTVWLAERHSLPLVAVTISIPKGSAADPTDKPGLAHITADMLDEGAGKLGAVELSSAINDLGASLDIGVAADGSYASLVVLKKNFDQAFGLLADIVARPRFEPKEWKRVSDLWRGALQKRADDPAAVSRVVSAAAHYGPGSPYAHPADGLLRGALAINLPDVKAFYAATWRPDQATIVIAGDVTKDEATKAIEAALGGWKAPAEPASKAPAPEGPSAKWKPPRLVLVDRPEAPQAVIAVVRDGVSASSPSAPLLDLINTALGGSFTSRINQSLREEHGWSYGARSTFSETRGQGVFTARAAVHTEVTGLALKELLAQLTKMAASGLTADEHKKVLAQDRGDLVQAYESVGGVSARLGRLAMLGLAPTFDAQASRARQQAALKDLAELARAVDPKGGTIVVVGPRAQVAPQLAPIGLGEPELWDAEGARIGAAPAPLSAPATTKK